MPSSQSKLASKKATTRSNTAASIDNVSPTPTPTPDPTPPDSNKPTETEPNPTAPSDALTKAANTNPAPVLLSPPTQTIQESLLLSSDNEVDKDEKEKEDEESDEDLSDLDIDDKGNAAFTTHHFSGTYPTPDGVIAKIFASLSHTNQLKQMEELVIIDPTKNLMVAIADNFTNRLQPFLIAVPGNTRKVRVLYALTKGNEHEILKSSPAKNDIAALHGEFKYQSKFPSPIVLPSALLFGRVVHIPEGEQFSNKRTDPANTKLTWYKPSQIRQDLHIPTIIPVPAFLIYDAFENDIDSLIIYERWMTYRGQLVTSNSNSDLLLRTFLKAQTVTSNKKCPQSQVDIHIFMDNTPNAVDMWAAQTVQALMETTPDNSDKHRHIQTELTSPLQTSSTHHQQQLSTTQTTNPSSNTLPPSPTQTPTPHPTTMHQTLTSTSSPPTTATSTRPPTLTFQPTTTTTSANPPAPARNPTTTAPTPTLITQPPALHSTLPSHQTPIHNLISSITHRTHTPNPSATPTAEEPYQSPASTANALPPLPPGFTMAHMAALMATSMQLAQQANYTATSTSTNTNSAPNSTIGLQDFLGTCEDSHIRLLTMCGLPLTATVSEVPAIWHRIAKNKGDPAARKAAAKAEMRENVLHNDARVVPVAPLLIMIIKRDFEEEIIGSCRKTASKGLTLFAVPTMSQAIVNKINDHYTAVETATQTTVKDVTSAAYEAVAPQSYHELTRVIKRFSNLLFALFGKMCPLLVEMEQVLEELQEYSEQAVASMSVRTIVSIAWIIHLQSRHFSQGKMIPPTLYIPEFANMKVQISTKQQVAHGDVPTEMYDVTPPALQQSANNANNQGNKRKIYTDNSRPPTALKKPKLFTIEHYHPKIKEAMKIFASHQKVPRVKAICEVCNIRQDDIFPRKRGLCIKSALFGTCFESCQYKHEAVSDDEAKKAITMLKPAIDNPDKVKTQ